MPSKPPKGYIYKNSGGKGKGSSGSSNAGDVQYTGNTPVMDDAGFPVQSSFGQPLTNPNLSPFQGTQHKFLGLIPYTRGGDLANQLNLGIQSQYAQQQALMPGQLAQYNAEQDKQASIAKQGMIDKLGLEQEAKEKEQADAGRALFSNANNFGGPLQDFVNKTVPMPMTTLDQHNAANLNQAYQSMYGANSMQGSLAGIPKAEEAATGSMFNTGVNQGKMKYATTIGDETGKGEVLQKSLENKNMPDMAAARLQQQQGLGLTSAMTPGGFDLREHQILSPDRYGIETRNVNIGGMQVPHDWHSTFPASVKSFVSPEEEAQVQTDLRSKQANQIYPLLSQPTTQTTFPKTTGVTKLKNGKVESAVQNTVEPDKQKEAEALKKIMQLLAPYNY